MVYFQFLFIKMAQRLQTHQLCMPNMAWNRFSIILGHWKSFSTPKTSAIEQNVDNKDVSKEKCVQ